MRGCQFFALSFLWMTSLPALAQVDTASNVYEKASKSVFLIVIRSQSGEPVARGSGFLVAGNKIVTNQHVVREGIPFLDLGAVKLPLKVDRVDSINDIAILTVDGELSVPALQLATAEPKPGISIFAIGNPAGLEKSISNGVVAGIRQMSGRELIQISAPISPGSSGGPILNSQAQVIAVAVGILEEGQNLNFAVPIKFVEKLLNGDAAAGDIPTLFSRVDDIFQKRSQNEQYSAEPDSPWMKSQRDIEGLLRQSVSVAGKDYASLKLVADKVMSFGFWSVDPTIAVTVAERMVQVRSNAESNTLLAKSLDSAAGAETPPSDKNSPTIVRAERAIRAAFASTKQPTIEMYIVLGDILDERQLLAESKGAYLKSYELAKLRGQPDDVGRGLRGLITTSAELKSNADTDRWFGVLVDTGLVGWYDREQQARRLYARDDYKGAGDNFALAASPTFWTEYCDAATAYAIDGKDQDRVLEMARACVANGANKKDSDARLANAHNQIAQALNMRGVHEEALSHVREAVSMDPQNAFYQDTLADSLYGLRRFQEAINASKQAIRLSDGKYAWMHFTLGNSYFDIENWELARQSYEKASQLDPKDDAATYNVAVCLGRLGLLKDAADWYEETLRRNPNRPNKQELLNRIQSLRK